MQSTLDVKNNIREYIATNADIENLECDVKIFETGLVNSLFAIQLMTYIEKTFNIKIKLEDLNMDNFETVDSIVEFINFKVKGA